jgi:hypothetical protein
MAITLKRYREIRRADDLNDQRTTAAILTANASSTTQEDYQTYVLSRVRQLMFGDALPANWYDDFQGQEIPSLRNAHLDLLLAESPMAPDTTYANIKNIGNHIVQETWTRTVLATKIKRVDYTYLLNRVTTEVTKVFALDGSTILAQTTDTYSYTGGFVTGIVTTRDI